MAGSYANKTATPSKKLPGTKQSSIKRNSSILSFFQKTDTPPGATSRQARITQFATPSSRSPSSGRGTLEAKRRNELIKDTSGGLFLEDKKGLANIERAAVPSEQERSPTPDIWGDDEESPEADDQRYNESDSAVKRRKVESPSTSADEAQQTEAEPATTKAPAPPKIQKRSGPFIDESDSEDDMEAYREIEENNVLITDVTNNEPSPIDKMVSTERPSESAPPPLVRAATNDANNDEHANFDDLEEEDELIGEESRNWPWEGEEETLEVDLELDAQKDLKECSGAEDIDREVTTCPICDTALKGFNETVGTLLLFGFTACLFFA